MDFGLTGKLALVTGASKGIGATTAGVLARERCEVILASRSAGALDDLAGAGSRPKQAAKRRLLLRIYPTPKRSNGSPMAAATRTSW
jgi:NAD(P)-dependent dehydrogenase (short-subunit alcohol dehydrogenase family)